MIGLFRVVITDIGKIAGDSFSYAKEGLVGKWSRWILLIISCIIFPLIMGYAMRIYRGVTPSPELEDWGGLFIDGIKLFIVGLIYAIPVLIVEVAVLGGAGVAMLTSTSSAYANPTAMLALFGAVIFGMVILAIVAIIIGIITATAFVRFARTGRFGEAFNFSAIFEHIGKLGVASYILALIVLAIIVGIIEFICLLIPFGIGLVILFILLPFFAIFHARYLCLLFDSAGTA